MSRFLVCLLGAVVVLSAGCSSTPGTPGSEGSRLGVDWPDEAATPPALVNDRANPEVPVAAGQIGANQPAKGKEAVERKIISTATLRIIVEDFGPARERLDELVKEHKGAFVAHADQSGSPGSPRSGTWTLRVPADKLDALVTEIRGLGEVTRSTLDAKDVTEEYYDVEADIRNKKVEEEAYLNLEKTATTFDNVLAAKREVQRVRTEIDRLQKRLAVLANLTTLATVNLTLLERKDYVPETTYSGTLARTWYGSLNALLTFGKNLLLVIVAVFPWLVVFGVVLGPLAWLVRGRWVRARIAEVLPAEGDDRAVGVWQYPDEKKYDLTQPSQPANRGVSETVTKRPAQ